jgi:carboxyl-terminal processing protease
MKSKWLILPIILLSGLLGFATENLLQLQEPSWVQEEINDKVFLDVFEQLKNDHYSQPSDTLLYEGAIQGMIDILGDPHTMYFNTEAYAQYQSNFGESYVGIGVSVHFQDNLIVVDEVFAGSPAEQGGILPKDIIVSVDSTDIREQDIYKTLSMIIGEVGTEVTIGVLRAGFDEEIPFVLVRDVIENSSVNFDTFDTPSGKIGYIEVRQFGDETATKFHDALITLEAIGIDGLIIDLRNNGGGHLTAVLNMLQEFLVKNDKPIFSTEYYQDGEFQHDDYFGGQTQQKSYDIVTLVNGASASASEVFASAMKEHGGYTLIGTKTYGKGTMQVDRVLTSTESDRLHLSIGRWLTSDGNWVHFNGGSDGIMPDISVTLAPYETAYKMFLIDGDTLQYDEVDDKIANLQVILNALGYNVRTDGYFDQETEDAVLELEALYGLTQDGIVDEIFLGHLNDQFDFFLESPSNDTILQAGLNYFAANNSN